ncbi:hypothetical protein E8E14_014620 [Neopestalotiopsis sp. 37M]|nr:hypothetical protein E8E14_014620 [Neopestalotiopsis sp. 37M]
MATNIKSQGEKIRNHKNAKPLLAAWGDRADTENFPAVLVEVYQPREWFSEDAKSDIIEILSNLTLDSKGHTHKNYRKVREILEFVAKTGESVHWDPRKTYHGPLPSHEEVEALRIVGSKVGGFGFLPKPIEHCITKAKLEFLLENPVERKTPIHPFWAARFEQNSGMQKDSVLPAYGDQAKIDSSNRQPNGNAAQDTFDEDDTLQGNEEGDHSEDNNTDASGTPTDEEEDDGDDGTTEMGRNTIAGRILGSKIFISVVSDAMANAGIPVKDECIKTAVNSLVLRDVLQRAITKAVEVHGRERNGAKRRRASSSAVVGRRKSARPATDED